MTILRVDVLGSVVAHVGGRTIPVTSAKQAAVLACLALQAPRLTGVSTLIDAIWGDEPPAKAEQGLQQHVSALRGLLEPDRAPRAEPTLLITEANGYRLVSTATDATDFGDLADRGDRAATAGRWTEALRALDAALTCWRGPALAGVPATAWFAARRLRLTQRRLAVAETRLSALLGLGQYGPLISDCEELLAQEPLREGVWAQLMQGLALSGRTADALAAYGRARRTLRDELGLEPSAMLRELEHDILARAPVVKPPAGDPGLELARTFAADVGPMSPWVQLPDGQVVALPAGVHRVGRHPEATVRFNDSRVSRWHAEFEHGPDGVRIRDLGSTNGTTINGTAVSTGVLTNGDVVGIGGVTLLFHG